MSKLIPLNGEAVENIDTNMVKVMKAIIALNKGQKETNNTIGVLKAIGVTVIVMQLITIGVMI